MDPLYRQREEALKIHIEPTDGVSGAALVGNIAKVLSDLQRSYESFLLAEFLRIEGFANAHRNNPKIFESIKQELALRAVDLRFASCEILVAPTKVVEDVELFANEVRDWEESVFPIYRDDIFLADLNQPSVLEYALSRYSPEHRAAIYRPLISLLGDGKTYHVKGSRGNDAFERLLQKPSDTLVPAYAPKVTVPQLKAEKNLVAYLKAGVKPNGEPDLSSKGIKQVFFHEEVPSGVHPFKPDVIRYDGTIFALSKKLEANVTYEDGIFFITADELDITVWAETREQAEDAFAFAFYSAYLNYHQAADDELTPSAIEFKNQLHQLIQHTYRQ